MCVWHRLGMSITARLPGGRGLLLQAPDDGRPAAADGDEVDVPSVDARQLGVVDHLAVEVEPLGVGAGRPRARTPRTASVRRADRRGSGWRWRSTGSGCSVPGRRRSARSARPCPAAAGSGGRAPAGSPRKGIGWKSSENPSGSGKITGARALTHPCNRPRCWSRTAR